MWNGSEPDAHPPNLSYWSEWRRSLRAPPSFVVGLNSPMWPLPHCATTLYILLGMAEVVCAWAQVKAHSLISTATKRLTDQYADQATVTSHCQWVPENAPMLAFTASSNRSCIWNAYVVMHIGDAGLFACASCPGIMCGTDAQITASSPAVPEPDPRSAESLPTCQPRSDDGSWVFECAIVGPEFNRSRIHGNARSSGVDRRCWIFRALPSAYSSLIWFIFSISSRHAQCPSYSTWRF